MKLLEIALVESVNAILAEEFLSLKDSTTQNLRIIVRILLLSQEILKVYSSKLTNFEHFKWLLLIFLLNGK